MPEPGAPRPATADGSAAGCWVGFARALRGAGLAVPAAASLDLVRALARLGLARRGDVKAAARACLVKRREDWARFDAEFERWFGPPQRGAPPAALAPPPAPRRPGAGEGDAPGEAREERGPAAERERGVRYSPREDLRRLDFARWTPAELAALGALLERLPLRLPTRPGQRTRALGRGRRGRVLDLGAVLRERVRGGEAGALRWRERVRRPRRVILVCDVSGSMAPYARALLGLARVLRTRLRGLEAFAFATRLTRISGPLAERDPDRMLERIAAAARDYGGGTRIGAALRELRERWLRPLGGSRALVLVLSDGLDRGEPERLGREVARLAAACHRLLWLSPLLGVPGYSPRTAGVRALLPHVDAFLPAHDLRSLERLAVLLGRVTSELPRSAGAPARAGFR